MSKVVFYSSQDEVVAQYVGNGYEDVSITNYRGVHEQIFKIRDYDGSEIHYHPTKKYITKVEIQKIKIE